MLGKCSFIIAPALVASLALPQGFGAEALAAPSQAKLEVTAPSAPQDPCNGKGYGCPLGVAHGYQDGHRCGSAHPNAGADKPDYTNGYWIGYKEGWAQAKCAEKG
jgi:hypothetical protein